MHRAARAGLGYFVPVLAAGFVLGTARALLVEPAVGPLAAVLIELPLMLGIAWTVARWQIGRHRVPATTPARVTMGSVAFLLLLAAEVGLAVSVFGMAPGDRARSLLVPAGAAGLRTPIALAESGLALDRPPPRLGEHTDEILAEIADIPDPGAPA